MCQEALLKMFERMGKKSESKCFNVGVNSDESPSWHDGVVGSITHSREGVMAHVQRAWRTI